MVGHFRPRDLVKGVSPYCFYKIFFHVHVGSAEGDRNSSLVKSNNT